MSFWSIGGNIVIYLAALQRLPRDLHEAAALDGATRWQQLRHITLPLLSPVTFFLLIVGLINAFQLFTPMYVLTRGGPSHATMTTALYLYFNAFQWQKLGQAAVMAWLLCTIIGAVLLWQFRMARRWVFYAQE
ncbi:MAG: sugar ABC transporter permease, partial [Ardenticatenales bacterium]|nr:sugar ABC transporter permease [Ardenticatenales bacterium]